MSESKEMITTSQAAELLNVKPSTVHKYVKEGQLKPVYEDNWHIDNTKLFYMEDIERLIKEKQKPGLTTGEVSKFLGLHKATVFQYIQQGQLVAEKKLYRGREVYFVSPEELERFRAKYEEMKLQEGKEFFDKDTKYGWFQTFVDSNGNLDNFLTLDENGTPYLKSHEGKYIPLNKIDEMGYSPAYKISGKNYITKKGYAKFLLHEDSKVFYQAMKLFYTILGSKNMKITIQNPNLFLVEVKPILIKEELSNELYEFLDRSISEGTITKRLDGVYIDSALDVITIAAPTQLKKRIKADAERNKVTMEEWVISILKEKYDM